MSWSMIPAFEWICYRKIIHTNRLVSTGNKWRTVYKTEPYDTR